ncbi:hypothetical protein KY349_01735 [Candidatus Woesearchaeota archaeon]|nr:hypothetical protein [Candidatus Woesearchaeota archaeon]
MEKTGVNKSRIYMTIGLVAVVAVIAFMIGLNRSADCPEVTGMQVSAGGYNVVTFLDRDASLVNIGLLDAVPQPNSQINIGGTTVSLYKTVRMTLSNGQTFSTTGFFTLNNEKYIYYSNHPLEKVAWFARIGPDGIITESSPLVSEAPRIFDPFLLQDWSDQGVETLTLYSCQTIFNHGSYNGLWIELELYVPPGPW